MKWKHFLIVAVAVLVNQIVEADGVIVALKPSQLKTYQFLTSSILKEVHEPGALILVEADQQTIQNFQNDPNVRYVIPNRKLQHFGRLVIEGPELMLRKQWALEMIRAPQAWDFTGFRGSKDIGVAVVDTGVDYKHLALKSNMRPGYNFIDNNEDPMDIVDYGFNGHGTHCAGVVGADGSRENGTIGVSPLVGIIPLRFISVDGGTSFNAIRAIDFAVANGARIISAS